MTFNVVLAPTVTTESAVKRARCMAVLCPVSHNVASKECLSAFRCVTRTASITRYLQLTAGIYA